MEWGWKGEHASLALGAMDTPVYSNSGNMSRVERWQTKTQPEKMAINDVLPLNASRRDAIAN